MRTSQFSGNHRNTSAFHCKSDIQGIGPEPRMDPGEKDEGHTPTPMICYGTICDVKFQVDIRYDPADSDVQHNDTKSTETYFRVRLCFGEGYCGLQSLNGKDVGTANTKTYRALEPLLRFDCIRFEPCITTEVWKSAMEALSASKRSTIISADVNAYGGSSISADVGTHLSGNGIFLQRPVIQFEDLPYENPQYLRLPNVAHVRLVPEVPESILKNTNQNLEVDGHSFDIDVLFEELSRPSFLIQATTDFRIKTKLLSHQKDAIDFIRRRETGDIPLHLNLWQEHTSETDQVFYQHIITGAMNVSPEDSFGGILADDMGLGKSLSMISAIVVSKDHALKFACFHELGAQPVAKQVVASKATLIVVPSALLIDGWIDEIGKHTVPGTLYLHRYHGQDKLVDCPTLLESDIVVTTYATLAMEYTHGRSILHHIHWYRLVLDEAHVIRNPSTKQFEAIYVVPAYIRWCLTGTPIQNTLEDLGALVRFLRVPGLGDAPMFRKHIIAPTLSKSTNHLGNLRHLLGAVCLRRTRTVLPLLEPAENIVSLEFSRAEAERYKEFGNTCRRAIDIAVSGHNVKKVHQCVLEAILRLRLFCNHGFTEAMGSEFPQGFPSDLENAYSIFQTQDITTCAYCSNDLSSLGTGHDATSPALTVCHHLLCEDCVPKYQKELETSQNESSIKECPICHLRNQNEVFVTWESGSPATAASGCPHPTKLLAIVDDIEKHIQHDKSIIFSFWRRTLDRLAHLLQIKGLPFLRVDGSVPLGKRRQTLFEFYRNPDMKVLLITFGTGAVGLNNLSVANRVHIVEPQWNPAVESQAIARILRLGQTRAVTVVRYIMNKSVEQSVQSRQLRKIQLAHGGFRYGNGEDTNQKVQQVMDLLFPAQNTLNAQVVSDSDEAGQSSMDLD